jgi:hypothetical protein
VRYNEFIWLRTGPVVEERAHAKSFVTQREDEKCHQTDTKSVFVEDIVRGVTSGAARSSRLVTIESENLNRFTTTTCLIERSLKADRYVGKRLYRVEKASGANHESSCTWPGGSAVGTVLLSNAEAWFDLLIVARDRNFRMAPVNV